MTAFTVIVVALVLALGLQSAVVQTGDLPKFRNYPSIVNEQIQHRQGQVGLSSPFRPLPPLRVEEEEVENVVVPELKPLPIPEDPCTACFAYMTSLIDQLTDVTQPSVPEIETLPLPVEPEMAPEIESLPHPEEPEFVFHPYPIPPKV